MCIKNQVFLCHRYKHRERQKLNVLEKKLHIFAILTGPLLSNCQCPRLRGPHTPKAPAQKRLRWLWVWKASQERARRAVGRSASSVLEGLIRVVTWRRRWFSLHMEGPRGGDLVMLTVRSEEDDGNLERGVSEAGTSWRTWSERPGRSCCSQVQWLKW